MQREVDTQPTLRKTTSYKIQELKIGNRIPDILFQNVLNYKENKLSLSDLRGKIVILDMWSVTCTSCITAFPKMQKLQNEFQDKIQILLVDPHDPPYDSEDKIKSVLEKNKVRTGFYPSLPIPIHDSILNIYFPHQVVPHEVWINEEGVVVAITGASDVTKENIQALLKGNKSNIPIKNDWKYDRNIPLLVDGNGGLGDDFLFRSLFTKYNRNIESESGRRTRNSLITGYYFLNVSLRDLVLTAYSDLDKGFPLSRIFFDVTDRSKYKQEFDTANVYCYDLTIPPTTSKLFKVNKYLQEDLRRFFNISAYNAIKKLPCIVVSATNKIERSDSGKVRSYDLDQEAVKKYIQHCSVEESLNLLAYHINVPLVNETGSLQEFIDIDFPLNFDISNTESIIQILRSKGFNVRKEERDMKVLVITDK